MIKQIKYNNVSGGRIQISVLLKMSCLTTILTFPLWSNERGDVCEVDQHQIGDGVDEPLDTDVGLERVDVFTDGDLQPGG